MQLNTFVKIALEEWISTKKIRDNCKIHESIIMPNHLHDIIEIIFQKECYNEIGTFKSPSQTIGSIVRGFKIATIKRIKKEILGKEELIEKEGINNINKGKLKRKELSTGELQFAPTAPTKKIISLDFKIWQRNYYEHIIRDEKSYQRISEYILNNPKKWIEDKFYKQ